MSEQRSAPGDAALDDSLSRLLANPLSVADFVDDRPPDVQALEYQQFLQQGWHAAVELHQKVLEDAGKMKLVDFIIDTAKQERHQQKQASISFTDRRALTPEQAAAVLGMKRSKLYTILTSDDFHPERTDGLPSFKDGNQRLILPEDADEYNRRRGGSNGATKKE